MKHNKRLSHYFDCCRSGRIGQVRQSGRGTSRKHYSHSWLFKLTPVGCRYSKSAMYNFWFRLISVGVLLGIVGSMIYMTQEAKAQMIDPAGEVDSKEVIVVDLSTLPKPGDVISQDFNDLKTFAKKIFGSEWKIAVGVCESECNHTRKDWPNSCQFSWAKEHSIGWCQVNLAENGGYGRIVHADKVPGKTMAEKETWLKNPYNNLLMVKVIRDQNGGWHPWTAYTNKSYLNTMPK